MDNDDIYYSSIDMDDFKENYLLPSLISKRDSCIEEAKNDKDKSILSGVFGSLLLILNSENYSSIIFNYSDKFKFYLYTIIEFAGIFGVGACLGLLMRYQNELEQAQYYDTLIDNNSIQKKLTK